MNKKCFIQFGLLVNGPDLLSLLSGCKLTLPGEGGQWMIA
jgi:hypothetical protein